MHHRWSVAVTRAAVFGVLATLWVSVPAGAAPIFWSRTYLQVSRGLHGGSAGPVDSGQVLGSDTLFSELTLTDPHPYAETYAAASVTDGALRARVNAEGAVVGPSEPYVNVAGGTAFAQFSDTLRPVSATLAPGTIVGLRIDWELTYLLAGNGCTDQALVYAGIIVDGSFSTTGGAQRTFQDSTCPSADFEFDQGDLQVVIGQEFVAETLLFAITSGVGPTSADAGSTLRLVLTPLDDFSLQAASGNYYRASQVTPVPEPASLTLFGTSLACLAAGRWRRRKNLHRTLPRLAPTRSRGETPTVASWFHCGGLDLYPRSSRKRRRNGQALATQALATEPT